MRLRHLVLGSLSLAVATLTHAKADAQAIAPDLTFDAVKSYSAIELASEYAFIITGVQHGASAQSVVQVVVNGQRWDAPPTAIMHACEHDLQVMVNRPGRFSLGLYNPNPGYVLGCSLTQLP